MNKRRNEIKVPEKYGETTRIALRNLDANFSYREPIHNKSRYFSFKNVQEKNKFKSKLKWYLLPRRDIIKSIK